MRSTLSTSTRKSENLYRLVTAGSRGYSQWMKRAERLSRPNAYFASSVIRNTTKSRWNVGEFLAISANHGRRRRRAERVP
jgi:hypothetical protein